MFRFAGRGGPQDQAEAAALLDKAAKLGHVAAAYNLALLYLEGQQVPQDIARAAELLRGAADAGSPEAQYALATLYKEGNGVPKDPAAAAKLLGAAARSGNVAAQVEYAIALFNGTGVAKDESAAAALFRKAAQQGQCGRAEPARAHSGDRPRPARRPGRGHQVAHHRQGRRRVRRLARRLHAGVKDSERAAGENAARLWLAHAEPPPSASHGLRKAFASEHLARSWSGVSGASQSAQMRHAGAWSSSCRPNPPSLNVMTAAARKAGRSLKRDFGEVENLQVSLKGPANFVSAADHRAEEILRDELLKARPGYGFLGEEGGRHEGTDKTHTWMVDPLDGTTNFLHGIPHFAISIALEREGTPIAGLIYNPANDEFFTAERGKGAFLNDRRIRVAARKRLAEAVVCCALPHHGRGDLALFRQRVDGGPGQGRGAAALRRGRARSRLGRGRPLRRLLGARALAVGFRRRRAAGARGRRLRHRS